MFLRIGRPEGVSDCARASRREALRDGAFRVVAEESFSDSKRFPVAFQRPGRVAQVAHVRVSLHVAHAQVGLRQFRLQRRRSLSMSPSRVPPTPAADIPKVSGVAGEPVSLARPMAVLGFWLLFAYGFRRHVDTGLGAERQSASFDARTPGTRPQSADSHPRRMLGSPT
jgi:hypothetical protein